MKTLMSDKIRRPLIVVLLFLFMVINFADKLVVGIVALPMREELSISASEFGLIGSSFYVLFSASAVLTGIYSHRFRTRTILAVLLGSWSILQLPIIFAASFETLLVSRLLLGAAEGPATPMCLLLCYKWFSNRSRTLPTTLIITFGSAAGVGIGSPLLMNISQNHGWRAPFAVLAVLGAVWLAAWLLLGKEEPDESVESAEGAETAHADARISYPSLLLTPTYLSIVACAFCAYWITTLLVVWFPSFLSEVRNLKPSEVAWLMSGIATAKALMAISGTTVSHLMSARGIASRQARGFPMAICAALGGAGAFAVGSGVDGMTLVISAIAMFGAVAVIFPIAFAMAAELAPPTMRGGSLSILSASATAGGLFAPMTMGSLIEWSGSPAAGYSWGFIATSVLALVGALAALFFVRPERDGWRLPRGRQAATAAGAAIAR